MKSGAQTKRRRWSVVLGVLAALAFAALGTAGTALADDPGGHASAPWITSDKADYAPGELVNLTGGSWQPGESVHINVNDDLGQSWMRDVDVTADASGNISDSFTLPDWFIATYSVRATGASGAVATSSFTDGNVVVRARAGVNSPLAVTFPIGAADRFNNTTCTAPEAASNSSAFTTNGSNNNYTNSGVAANNTQSVKIDAPSPITIAGTKYMFSHWEADSPAELVVSSTGCISRGPSAGNNPAWNVTANYRLADTTPPVITPSIAPPANGTNGWHKSGNVDVTFSVTDADSAITSKSAACDATSTVSTDGTHSFTCTATSEGGTASSTATVMRDVTIPNIALDTLPASTAASSINVTGTASDATSGVDVVSVNGSGNVFNPAAGTFSSVVPLVCGPNAISAGAMDKAGNKSADANASVTRICDTTPPVITKIVSGTLGSNSWYTSDVSVAWSVTDPDSAVVIDAGCGTQSFTSNTAGTTSGCTAHSDGGSSSDSVSLKIDKSAPVVSVVSANKANGSAYAAGTWSNQDVTVTFDCSDVGPSGVDSLSPNPVTKGEGENQTATTSCSDKAGNSAGGSFADIDIDKTAPGIAFVGQSPAKNANGWNNTDVTLSWTCSDALSGVVSPGDSQTISSEGENQQATGSCSDNAGNSASSTNGDVDIDKTAPGIAFAGQSPAKNGNGWNKTDVVLSWNCSDDRSGAVDPSVSMTISSEGTGQQATGTCKDKAGNSASSTDGDVNIDKTSPLVAVTGVVNGAVYIRGSVPAAGCNTSDSRSGVETNATVAVTGGTPNGVGTYTATCSGGKDKADNGHTPVSVTYRVEYTGLSGILQPINPDNTSLFSRGKAVPVKFRLAGDEPSGFNFSSWKLGRQQISCTSFDAIDAVQEPIVENPSNAFRYDAGADQYIYNANFSDKAQGSCWTVVVTLDSGQVLESATFKLQK